MAKSPGSSSDSRLVSNMISLPGRLVSMLEDLKISRRDGFFIVLFLIFLRNLLESQFEFPGFVGFVKVPIDSAFAFFLHFPLFYFAVFYSLYMILSWLRADQEKAYNVLVPGFSVILIPPLFDYIVMGRSYHLSYFYEFDAYAKGLVGIALPWLKDIGQVSIGQRIEVYLSNLSVFGYLLLSKRGIVRALVGFFATHLIIAGFGGIGILLTGFLQKNWLMFSHHQIFIQIYGLFLLIIAFLQSGRYSKNEWKAQSIAPNIVSAVAVCAGILFCLKLRLPLTVHPFVYTSIISVLIACTVAGAGFHTRNIAIALLCLCLAVSVRYETLIFILMLLFAVYMRSISKTFLLRAILSGLCGIFALYAAASVFFFYHAMLLTPVVLVVFVFIAGVLSWVLTKWWQLGIIYAATMLCSLLVPGRSSIAEHVKTLNAVGDFRQSDFAGVLEELKNIKATSLSNFLRGAALVNAGYAAKGLALLEEVGENEMDRNLVYAKLAAHNQLGELQNGVDVIDRGLHSGIMMDELYLEKARQLILKNTLYGARHCLDSAYALGAGKKDCLALAGDIAYRQGKYLEAINIYENVQKCDPADYYAYGQKGLVYFSLGDRARALHSFERALELNSRDGVVYNNYGVVLRSEGRFEEARQAFLNALKISPVFVDAFFNLGLLSYMEDRKEEAGYWYRKALEVNPRFSPAREGLEKLTE